MSRTLFVSTSFSGRYVKTVVVLCLPKECLVMFVCVLLGVLYN